MKKPIFIISIILLILFILHNILSFFLGHDEEINKAAILNQKKYYYVIENDTNVFEGLCFDNIKDRDSIIKFYDELAKGENHISLNINGSYPIPLDTAVYLVEYATKDSSFAKVIFHYKTDYSEEFNKVTYVYSKFLHDKKSTDNEQKN